MPFYAILGSSSVVFFAATDLIMQAISLINLKNIPHSLTQYKTHLKRSMILRPLFLIMGVIVGSIFLEMAQKTNNIFYSFPQFSLFMLLSIFNSFHTCYAIIPAQALKLIK